MSFADLDQLEGRKGEGREAGIRNPALFLAAAAAITLAIITATLAAGGRSGGSEPGSAAPLSTGTGPGVSDADTERPLLCFLGGRWVPIHRGVASRR